MPTATSVTIDSCLVSYWFVALVCRIGNKSLVALGWPHDHIYGLRVMAVHRRYSFKMSAAALGSGYAWDPQSLGHPSWLPIR
jgi:hypothetical protein